MTPARCLTRLSFFLIVALSAALTAFADIAPVVYGLPAGVTLNYGEAINFSPYFSGTLPITFQWKKDGVNLVGATSSYYGKGNVTTTDSGQYVLVASNNSGTATSSPVTVIVNPAVAATIYNLPGGSTVNYGETISLSPSIFGTQPMTFQWKKGGVNVAGATSATYSKNNATTADSGQYTLTATNTVGAVTSQPVTISVNPATLPTIYNLGGPQTLVYGGSFNFYPSVGGTQPMTFQWQKDGVAISGATLSYYGKNSLTPADTGLYALVATNGAGTVTSQIVNVTVNAAVLPSISGLGGDQTLASGANLSLYPSVSGSEPVTYQWKKDGIAISGANSSYYSRFNLTPADSGQYTLTATNSVGAVTSAAAVITVSVAIAPTITNLPVNLTVNYGDSISLNAAVAGTEPITYQWKKDGVVIAGATSSYYSKSNATPADAGLYALTATNQVEPVTSLAVGVTINAAVAPSFANVVATQNLSYGGYLSLSPTVSGTQPMTYQWNKNDAALAGATGNSFSRSGVTPTDAGQYTLTATNLIGAVTSTATTITVSAPVAPSISNLSTIQTVNYGESLSLNPSVSGTQPMTFQWKKDGVSLPGAASGYYSKNGATIADSGQYTLTVTNEGGTITSNAVVVTVNAAIAPVISNLPSALAVNFGDSLVFNPAVAGTLPMTIQWKKDGIVVPGAITSYYTKSNATPLESGSYVLTVTNVAGTATSSAVVVTVNAAIAPTIFNLPTALILGYGEALNLSPFVAGSQPMTLGWKKNGTIIPGAVSASYSIGGATSADSGSYVLTATNAAGTTISAAVVVTVQPAIAPSIFNLTENFTNPYGVYFSVSATVTGTSPMTYQWAKDGVAIAGATYSSFSKSYPTTADTGQYTLTVTNVAGNVTSALITVTVSPAFAPVITNLPASVTLESNDYLSLSPTITGTSPISFQWKKDGVNLAYATNAYFSKGNVTTADSGQYTLVATNLVGAVTSSPVMVTVNGAVVPAITQQPVALSISQGLTANFSVFATGTNPMIYQWNLAGQPVAGATNATLVISNVQPINTGTYTVVVTNAGGMITSAAATLSICPSVGVTGAAAGSNHSLFIKSDGTLWAMGNNGSGALGDGTTTNRLNSIQIAAGMVATTGGADHSLVIKSDGSLWAMGGNSFGQLGDGTTTDRSTPVSIATGVVSATAGVYHSLFIQSDGTLWGTGNNSDGQLGDGTAATHLSPVQISTGVVSVAAGTGHSLFVKSDRTLWAMGNNAYGQLGDGTTTTRFSPVQVATGVVSVTAGTAHSLFIKSDGTLWAMGWNGYGELGDGTTTSHLSPVQISTGVMAATAGADQSLFIKSDGTLWAMGWNGYGQLGDGTATSRPTPVQITTGVVSVTAGAAHSLFIKSDGTLWTMGYNYTGQLGDGTATYSYTPIKVAHGPLIMPSSPTGVTATDGTLVEGTRISWNPTIGATGYEVWRSTTNNSASAVRLASSVPLALYYDLTATSGVTYYYWVKSVNSAGSSALSSSDAGHVGTAAAPVITTQPLSNAAFAGGSVRMTAVVTGTPTPTYQWQKNGINVSAATSASLSLSNVQITDAGSYALVATNPGGSVTSRFARLVVLVAQANATTYAANVFPTGVTAGGTVGLDYLLTNIGTKNWGANHYLSIRDRNGTFVAFSPLVGVNSGENKAAHLTFTAPTTVGSYTYAVQGLENGVEFFSTQTTFTLNVLAPSSNSITYNSTNFAISATPGSNLIFNFNVTNTGTNPWGANHYLTLRDGTGVYAENSSLKGVASGQSKTVNLSFAAPTTPGVYPYYVQATETGVGASSTQANLTLTVLAPHPNAMVYTATRSVDNVTPSAIVNLRYSLSNAGTSTWGASHYVSLRDANGTYLAFVPLSGVVPAASTTVNFGFAAPTTPGIYTYTVQGLEDGVEFFDTQDVVVVTVLATPMANAATYNATTFPSAAARGASVSFTSNVTNRGAQTWGANHYLSLRDADNTFLGFLPISGVAPGANKTVGFTFAAPSTPGIYTYHVQGFESGIEFFNMSDNLVLIVP